MENSLLLSQKHTFEKHPLEMGYKSYKDYHNAIGAPNHLNMVGEKLNELEHWMQTRDAGGGGGSIK